VKRVTLTGKRVNLLAELTLPATISLRLKRVARRPHQVERFTCVAIREKIDAAAPHARALAMLATAQPTLQAG
jgi:hypothetical protein